MKEVDATDVRRRFVDIAEFVRAGERLLVTRNGRPLVAIVSVEDAAKLEAGNTHLASLPVDVLAVEKLVRATGALPRLDPRSPEEIIGFDRHGIPG